MNKIPYVHSNYERKKQDDYQTIDDRCIKALISKWDIRGKKIVDCCASHGSGIVDHLCAAGYDASGAKDAFGSYIAEWIVTNPPYERDSVDRIANECLRRLKSGEVDGVAFLMRANWDLANKRAKLFVFPWYACQIRMRFRPWWSEERKSQPIHNFVWHIWQRSEFDPTIKYYP
jgi:hypothetical protein